MFASEDFDLLFGDDTAVRLGGYCHPGILATDGSARLTPPPDALEAVGVLQNPALRASAETGEWVTRVLAGQIVFDAFSAVFFASPPRHVDAPEGFDHAVRHLREAPSQVVKATALQFKPGAPTAVTALAYIRMLEASLVKRAQAADATKGPPVARTGDGQGRSQPASPPDTLQGVCHSTTGKAPANPHVNKRMMDGNTRGHGVYGPGSVQPPRREFSNVLPGMRWKPPDVGILTGGDSGG